jgi:hypothetical protein
MVIARVTAISVTEVWLFEEEKSWLLAMILVSLVGN